MRHRYEYYAGSSVITTPLLIPRRNEFYRLLFASVQVTRGALAPLALRCMLRIADGQGGLVAAVLSIGALGTTGQTAFYMFCQNRAVDGGVVWPATGTNPGYYVQSFMPGELWIPPQAQLSFSFDAPDVADVFQSANLTVVGP